jgi:hypothetical protein
VYDKKELEEGVCEDELFKEETVDESNDRLGDNVGDFE